MGCSALERSPEPEPTLGPKEGVFSDEYDRVWRAARIAMQNYPIRIDNMDKGILETDRIRAAIGWTPPHRNADASGGKRYYLSLRVVKGAVQSRPATRVTVHKKSELQKDFFSDSKELPSDGLEEITILYRIQRELEIEKALARAARR